VLSRCRVKCTDWSLKRFDSFQTQHKRAHDHQRPYRIIITTVATACNNRLIVETIITSNTGIAAIAYDVEHNAQGTPPHHGFSLLMSVQSIIPECIVHGKISGGHKERLSKGHSQKSLRQSKTPYFFPAK